MTSEEKMWETFEAFKRFLAGIHDDPGMEPTDKMFLLMIVHREARRYVTPLDDWPDDVRRYVKRVDGILTLEEARKGQVN